MHTVWCTGAAVAYISVGVNGHIGPIKLVSHVVVYSALARVAGHKEGMTKVKKEGRREADTTRFEVLSKEVTRTNTPSM